MALRTPLTAQPHLYIGDSTGRPLDYGRVYFGEPNKDPEFYPIDIYLDPEMTIAAAQPVRTKGGFMDVGGNLAELHAAEFIYSLKVLDQYGRQVFYKPEMYRNNVSDFLVDEITRATAAETLIAGNLTAETQRAIAAETLIADAVVTEKDRAVAAEVALDAKHAALSSTINSLGGGKKAYTTYALMVADKDNIDPNSSIDVTNDTDPLKNGTYSYDGAVFAKSIYDPVVVAKDYTNSKSATLSLMGRWLDEASKKEVSALAETSDRFLAAKAIKKIAVLTPVEGRKYTVITVYKNNGSYNSRVIITDNISGSSAVLAISEPHAVTVSGVKEYELRGAGGMEGAIVIDWDVLSDGTQFTNLNLGIDNTVSYREFKNKLDISKNTDDIDLIKTIPDWLTEDKAGELKSASKSIQDAAKAIKGIDVFGANSGKFLQLSAFAKQHDTYNTRIFITDSSGTIQMAYSDPSGSSKQGVETLYLEERNNSGITGTITVDWDLFTTGDIVSGGGPLVIKWNSVNQSNVSPRISKNSEDILALQSSGGGASEGVSTIPSKAYRVSIAGSSITWGKGFLGELSYVGVIEDFLRNQHATTLLASKIASAETTLTGNDFYKGEAKKISGLNKEVSFNLSGDELSLSLGLERENTGACEIELYVDGTLHDTFNTLTKQAVSKNQTFTGDGVTLQYDLDGCFTYSHVVKVGGVTKKGSVITTGSGVPTADDYAVIRRYDSVNNRVVHTVWFKAAPTGSVTVDYKQGENIRHLRGTIDRIGAGFDTVLENASGDGATSYDPAAPSVLSSGLGFRQSDERSVKTWRFSENKPRTFKLKIKSLSAGATGSSPYFILNFVTNRMHHIQNAGIGGWKAGQLLEHGVKINTIDYVIGFNPDILLIESSTNDDTNGGTGLFKAHVVRTGVTSAEILAEDTANYFTSISGSVNDKTVHDVRIPITAVTKSSITLDASVVDTNIAVGDAVVIGEYGGNHKRVQVRTVKAYDSDSKTITLNRFIYADEFEQIEMLDDLVGRSVYIYNAPLWVSNINDLADAVRSSLPKCNISIATAGVPHFYLRKLFGYKELAQQVALGKNLGFVDYYDATFDFQYSQPTVEHQTIASTGASEYALTGGDNVFANPQVFVDGIEHRNFRVVGGLSAHWASGISDPTLSNKSNFTKSFKLVFEKDIPASGAVITVKKSTTVWANDYCHPVAPQGLFVFGQASSKILKDVN